MVGRDRRSSHSLFLPSITHYVKNVRVDDTPSTYYEVVFSKLTLTKLDERIFSTILQRRQ
jgi:hypothetical protein